MSCSVSHFIIFGCNAYAHVPKQLRNNIDDKSEKSVCLGYGEESKAYKLYNPISKKVIINRDVLFDEESWDGTIDKVVEAVIPQPKDEEEEQFIGQQGPVAFSLVESTLERKPRNLVRVEASRLGNRYTPIPQ